MLVPREYTDNNELVISSIELQPSVYSPWGLNIQTCSVATEVCLKAVAIINVITIFATNLLHGTTSEFFRNDAECQCLQLRQHQTQSLAAKQFGEVVDGPFSRHCIRAAIDRLGLQATGISDLTHRSPFDCVFTARTTHHAWFPLPD